MVCRMIGAGLAALLAMAAAAPAAAQEQAEGCRYATSDPDLIADVLAQTGVTIDNYDAFCTTINAAGMGVDSNGFVAAQDDGTTAVVILRSMHLASNVRSTEMSFGMFNSTGTDEAARSEALAGAYNQALTVLAGEPGVYFASANAELARLQALYRAGVVPAAGSGTEDCRINYRTTTGVDNQVAAHGSLPFIPEFDRLCADLAARGMGLEMMTGQMMVGTSAHFFGTVGLFDIATEVSGSARSFALTNVSEATEEDVAQGEWETLEGALSNVSESSAPLIAALESVLARDREYFAAN